tara:strand:- start:158 stop:415 length:258 start_codon:yes stop_codon:yes gene_type:complete
MKFKILNLAAEVSGEDMEMSKRLISLAKKIGLESRDYVSNPSTSKGAPPKRREYLKLDIDTMIGLVNPSLVEYKDTLGKVEVESE